MQFRGGEPFFMAPKKTKKAKTHKIGRDAKTGEFIPVKEAKRRPQTTVVETIKNRPKKKPKKG